MRRFRRKLPSTIHVPSWPRRHPIGAVATVLIIVLIAVGRGYDPRTAGVGGSDWQRFHDGVFSVVNVVDGDTIDIDAPDGRYERTRLRLWGVDTPEVAGAPTGAMYWGPEASAFTKRTLLHRRVRIELIRGQERDKYDRLLTYVYLPDAGQMFNALLLREGHAYADTRFDHPHRWRFVELEEQARSAGRGLWEEVRVRDMPGWRQRREGRR